MALLRGFSAERAKAQLCFVREPAHCHRSMLAAAMPPEAEVGGAVGR